MEASSLPSSLQSAPPVANAVAASTVGADTASPSRQPFAQVMQQALATAQSHFARQSNAPTDNHGAATKTPLSSGPVKEQHRSQDSQTDPAATNPISMAVQSIPLPPLTLTPNLGLNADAQNPSPTAGSAGLSLVPLQVSTPACAAPALEGISSQPTMAASLGAATDTV